MNKKILFILLLVLGTAFWGISFPVTKMAMASGSQSTFLFYRFLGAAIVLLILLFKHVRNVNRKAVFTGAMLAIPLTFGIYFQTLGIKNTTASQCAFVAGMSVVIIPVLKVVFYKTSVELKIWVAAIVALAGLFIISIKDNLSIGIGDLYTIIGSLGFAVYMIKVEHYNRSNNILPTIVPMFATCALITLCMAIPDAKADWFPHAQGFWIGIAYCALFSTAYMYTISNVSQRYIKAEKVAIIYLFEPVFAAFAAMFLLDESLTWRLVLGGFLILIGTLIPEINFRRKFA